MSCIILFRQRTTKMLARLCTGVHVHPLVSEYMFIVCSVLEAPWMFRQQNQGCTLNIIKLNTWCILNVKLQNQGCTLNIKLQNPGCTLNFKRQKLECILNVKLQNVGCTPNFKLQKLGCTLNFKLQNVECNFNVKPQNTRFHPECKLQKCWVHFRNQEFLKLKIWVLPTFCNWTFRVHPGFCSITTSLRGSL